MRKRVYACSSSRRGRRRANARAEEEIGECDECTVDGNKLVELISSSSMLVCCESRAAGPSGIRIMKMGKTVVGVAKSQLSEM